MLDSFIWKGASALLLIITGALAIEDVKLALERKELRDRIENPETGYIAQVARGEAAIEQLRVSINQQNDSINALAADRNARLAAAQQQIDQANRNSAEVERKVAVLLAPGARSQSVCDQVLAADRRLLDSLK